MISSWPSLCLRQRPCISHGRICLGQHLHLIFLPFPEIWARGIWTKSWTEQDTYSADQWNKIVYLLCHLSFKFIPVFSWFWGRVTRSLAANCQNTKSFIVWKKEPYYFIQFKNIHNNMDPGYLVQSTTHNEV